MRCKVDRGTGTFLGTQFQASNFMPPAKSDPHLDFWQSHNSCSNASLSAPMEVYRRKPKTRTKAKFTSSPHYVMSCWSAFGITGTVLAKEFTYHLKNTVSKYVSGPRALSSICLFAFAVIFHDQCWAKKMVHSPS